VLLALLAAGAGRADEPAAAGSREEPAPVEASPGEARPAESEVPADAQGGAGETGAGAAGTDEAPPAQPPGAEPGFETVVTATRYDTQAGNVPETVTVVGRREARARSAVHADDLLRTAAAVTVRRPQGPADVYPQVMQMRGVSGIARVLVLVDGLPVNDALTGSPNLNVLPTEGVRRIELIRGPFSALWGSYAMAGVVNVVTEPGGEDPGATLGASAGPFDSYRLAGSAAGRLSWFEAAGSYELRSSDNYLASGGEANVDCRHHRGFLRLDAGRGGPLSGTLTAGFLLSGGGFNQYVDLRDVPSLRFYLRNEGRNEKDDAFARLAGRWLPHRDFELRAAAGLLYQWSRFHAIPVLLEGALPDYETQRSTYDATGWRLEGSGRWAFASWGDLVLGIDQVWDLGGWENTRLDDDTPLIGMDASASTTAGYGQVEITSWGDRLRLIGGARLDHHSTFGSAVSPKGGLSLEPVDGTVVRASAGRAFRSPSLMELYSPQWMRIPPYPTEGNPALQPETLWAVDGGVEQALPLGASVRINGFYVSGQSQIVFEVQPDGVERYVNGEGFWTAGVEAELGFGPPAPFGARLTYACLWTRDAASGWTIDYVPAHLLGLLLLLRVPLASWEIEGAFDIEVVGPRGHMNPRLPGAREVLPAHAVGNLSLQLRRGPFAAFVDVRNLWDASYEETADNLAARFTVLAGARMRWDFADGE
jgi:outer membrane cobalamin receptor